MNPYFKRRAAPWVSISVLAGGMVSALLLFYLARVERNIEAMNMSVAEEVLKSR